MASPRTPSGSDAFHPTDDPRGTEWARRRLLAAGADRLPRQPWQQATEPAADHTLLWFALWRANAADPDDGDARPEELRAALRLIESARSDLDALESALMFVARAEGLTWPEIAEQLGVRSPQAAQQRFQRVSGRAHAGTSDTAPAAGPEGAG